MKAQNTPISVQCVMCHNNITLMVAQEDSDEYKSGPERRHVQQIFPYLTAGERELLISRTCDSCWQTMFGEDAQETPQ